MSKKTMMILLVAGMFLLHLAIPRTPLHTVSGYDISEFGLIMPVLTLYTNEASTNIYTAIISATDFYIPLGNLLFSILLCYMLARFIMKKVSKGDRKMSTTK